ncbi:hypothetical protein BC629DRAFT_1498195 [Irpex lacteus]|nr:hypothetical protein BC629DRAFT_1498195 [Irpex lacteus]
MLRPLEHKREGLETQLSFERIKQSWRWRCNARDTRATEYGEQQYGVNVATHIFASPTGSSSPRASRIEQTISARDGSPNMTQLVLNAAATRCTRIRGLSRGVSESSKSFSLRTSQWAHVHAHGLGLDWAARKPAFQMSPLRQVSSRTWVPGDSGSSGRDALITFESANP